MLMSLTYLLLRSVSVNCLPSFFLLTLPPPPRSTLFPYTTLFRSHTAAVDEGHEGEHAAFALVVCPDDDDVVRSEEHTSELQSLTNLVCRLLLEKKKYNIEIVYR